MVSRRQMRALGFGDDAIDHAIRTGRLFPVFRGVYAVGHFHLDERGRIRAATLACEGAVASHRSAAALLGLLDRAPAVVDVIAPRSAGRQIDGIRPHLLGPLPGWQIGAVDGIPCTSPARTLVDMAGTVGERTLRDCFARAAARKLLDVGAIERVGFARRSGAPLLRELLDEWRPAQAVVSKERLRSVLEAKVLPLLARRRLPMPRANARVELAEGSIEVDFLWSTPRLVLEADSREFHATEVAFERDRWRDRELMRAGYSTLRVTRRQVETEADAVAEAIAARLV